MMPCAITLEELGYNPFFDRERKLLHATRADLARVTAEHREAYEVRDATGEYFAKVTGKRIFDAQARNDYPAVGDWVLIRRPDATHAVISDILPRKTVLKKKYSNRNDAQIIATNIDIAFIVASPDRDYNLNRIERYLVLAAENNIEPVIILNKIDAIEEAAAHERLEEVQKRFSDVLTIATSAADGRGLNELKRVVSKGKTCCFLGSSGVGKSSLINKLIGKEELATREISSATGRGKHTTVAREMYFLDEGGIVIDTPGTREVGMADTALGITNVFDEIAELSSRCKYTDCTHLHEPGCAVLKALADGGIDEARYQHYIKLQKENQYYEMTDTEKRQRDRAFGKFIKKALDQLKDTDN